MAEEPSERNSEIWSLAQTGLPHSAIAERFGISRQRVSRLIADMTPAAWGFTENQRAQIRAREAAVLDLLAKKAEEVIDHPPLQHSAIGKPIEDPLNPGSFLINEGVRVSAIRERRLLSESKRRLTGADLASTGPSRDQAQAAADASMNQLRAARDAEIAEMNRLRAEITARDCALAATITPQPGDNDITDAEIID